MIIGLLLFFAPLVVLVGAGALAADRAGRDVWGMTGLLLLGSTAVWLVYVGLYQHETPCDGRSNGCPTVYGYDAPLPDGHPAGMALLMAGFLVPAGWLGWRRTTPPATAGAALALGPTVLAGWTAPRGDNDGLWGLIFVLLPLLGWLAAVVAGVSQRIASTLPRSARPTAEPTVARASDRLAALLLDVTALALVLTLPIVLLSHADHEILAVVVAVVVSTLYFGFTVAWQGRSIGQSLVGLVVVDARTDRRLPAVRALLRSLLVVVEVVLAPTLTLGLPAVIELLALALSGRSVTDRLVGSAVLSVR